MSPFINRFHAEVQQISREQLQIQGSVKKVVHVSSSVSQGIRESVQAGHPQSSIQLILFYDFSPHSLLELHQVDFCLIGQLTES